jgi:hypothetical protein
VDSEGTYTSDGLGISAGDYARLPGLIKKKRVLFGASAMFIYPQIKERFSAEGCLTPAREIDWIIITDSSGHFKGEFIRMQGCAARRWL